MARYADYRAYRQRVSRRFLPLGPGRQTPAEEGATTTTRNANTLSTSRDGSTQN